MSWCAPADSAPPVEVEAEAEPPAEPEVVEAPAPAPIEPLVRPSFFDRLGKARTAFTGYLGGLVGRSKLSDDDWEELEEALIQADVGVATSMALDRRRARPGQGGRRRLRRGHPGPLKARMHRELEGKDRSLHLDEGKTNVWLFVGVNGVGKTTTIGKLASRQVDEGHKP